MKKLLIVGAGGFGRELYAWASQHPDCGTVWQLAGFLDDNLEALAPFGRFAPVLPISNHKPSAEFVYLAGLGLPILKEQLVTPLVTAGAEFLTFVHPQSHLGARVKIGKGVVICPGAILSVDIEVGDFAMINLNCTIGHDVRIGPWTSLSAQCDLTGHVHIADRVFFGSRASVIPSKTVGSRATVGAGAVVIKDVPPGVTVVGVPARIL